MPRGNFTVSHLPELFPDDSAYAWGEYSTNAEAHFVLSLPTLLDLRFTSRQAKEAA
jgi:hypothetical protein